MYNEKFRSSPALLRGVNVNGTRLYYFMQKRVSRKRRRSEPTRAEVQEALQRGAEARALVLRGACENDKVDLDWIEQRTVGYERILRQLKKVPIQDYAAFAGISMEQIESAAECISSTNKVAVYEDLGVEMSPYSTLCSYLNILMFVLPGAYDTEGGTHIPQGLGNILAGDLAHEDDNGYEFDRALSPVTGARLIQGLMPCNSIPEEILSDHPDRFRGMIVESANPVHSLADTKRFLEAFEALELVVVIDVAMTETARVADYVLPASSQYEKSEGTFFPAEFPENFFHLRAPVLDPLPGTLSEAEIYARLLEELDGSPTVAYEELKVAAEAAQTLAFSGFRSRSFIDVGVAGLWRLEARLPEIREADVVIVGLGVAGVCAALEAVAAKRGAPAFVRSDNGPEFVSLALQNWAAMPGAHMRYIKPGSPWQNGCVESFHDKIRDEFLQMESFATVAEARVLEVAVDVRDAEVEVLLVLRALAHVHDSGRREVDGPTLALSAEPLVNYP